MRRDLLWTESKDVWCVQLDPVWAEFHGTPAIGGGQRPVPLVDAFPITLWLYKQQEEEEKKERKEEEVSLAKKYSQGQNFMPPEHSERTTSSCCSS